MTFKFIHCADIHLDSPCRGLERYEGAPVEEIRGATREALKSLVRLCVEENVAFLLIAGDLYDGDWRDYNTGLFFSSQMSLLRQADIPVFVVSGNHDAASQITRQLQPPENVHIFPTETPDSVTLDDLGVTVHGQGFARRDVREDLSAAYPKARKGDLNIGMLHTSVDGREGHEGYAPCSLEGLLGKGYAYWALGHVHQREVLHREPWVVFPGNLQGRHIRETGAKGCSLVTVEGGEIRAVEHRSLDVLRWACCELDASGLSSADDVLDLLQTILRVELERAEERMLAVRIRIRGSTEAHGELTSRPARWTQEFRNLATDLSAGRAWLEKVEWQTSTPIDLAELAAGDEAIGGLLRYLDALRESESDLSDLIRDELSQLQRKLPPEILEGDHRLDLESSDALGRLIEDVRELLLTRLLGAEAGA